MTMSFPSIAAAHKASPPGLDLSAPAGDQPAVIRYDGSMKDGEPVVYAVVRLQDIARLSPGILDDLDISGSRTGRVQPEAGAFFVSAPQGPALYVNTNRHEDFLPRFADECEDRDIDVVTASGDLKLMSGVNGDMAPPATAAWVENGSPIIPAGKAMMMLMQMRIDRQISDSLAATAPMEDPDHGLPSLRPE